MIKLYSNLKKLREMNGFTQDVMAKKLGYNSKSAYNMKENGIRKVTVEEAYEIAKIFNRTIEEIFFETTVAKNATKLKETEIERNRPTPKSSNRKFKERRTS